MQDRLKDLKKLMNQKTFSQLHFSQEHQKEIRGRINQQGEREEDILLAVMQLLVHEKTGFELMIHLRGRGIRKFENNEGFLYSLLHRLEQNGHLQTNWDESGAKNYCLNDKGKKVLRKAEQKGTKRQFALKELLEG